VTTTPAFRAGRPDRRRQRRVGASAWRTSCATVARVDQPRAGRGGAESLVAAEDSGAAQNHWRPAPRLPARATCGARWRAPGRPAETLYDDGPEHRASDGVHRLVRRSATAADGALVGSAVTVPRVPMTPIRDEPGSAMRPDRRRDDVDTGTATRGAGFGATAETVLHADHQQARTTGDEVVADLSSVLGHRGPLLFPKGIRATSPK